MVRGAAVRPDTAAESPRPPPASPPTEPSPPAAGLAAEATTLTDTLAAVSRAIGLDHVGVPIHV
ncbi:hypothetical protein ACFXPX_13640 [Kitasatospora sp. NPDC059146]|uniref:hypothetical protein n=1 Tax=Kitasatospora sp. NPDC059146 TaxID=3346741 RepID=UPI0036780DA8